MRIVRAGRGSSAPSNKSNSIPVAWRENTLKFTPPSMTVAPIGALVPGVRSLELDVGADAGVEAPRGGRSSDWACFQGIVVPRLGDVVRHDVCVEHVRDGAESVDPTQFFVGTGRSKPVAHRR